MTDIAAGEFKARCLRLLDQVAQDRVELVITKRGRPVAKLVPVDDPPDLRGSVTVLVDQDSAWFSTSDLIDDPGGLGSR